MARTRPSGAALPPEPSGNASTTPPVGRPPPLLQPDPRMHGSDSARALTRGVRQRRERALLTACADSLFCPRATICAPKACRNAQACFQLPRARHCAFSRQQSTCSAGSVLPTAAAQVPPLHRVWRHTRHGHVMRMATGARHGPGLCEGCCGLHHVLRQAPGLPLG